MESWESAEADYMLGMKYKDIAVKYGTTINTVKSWKKRHGWNRKEGAHKNEKGCTQNLNAKTEINTEPEDGTQDTLKDEALTSKYQLFCIYYSRTFNATQSYLRVFQCSYDTANSKGYKLLQKPCVRKEIERLKEVKRQQIVADTSDIVELQMRIAFSDIGNYLSFGRETVPVMGMYGPVTIENEHTGEKEALMQDVNVIRLNESGIVDTQLIQEVKQGRDGVSVKLADKQKAFDWLSKFFEANPADVHRREFDKRRLDLELLKLEMQNKDSEDGPGVEKDNFLEALDCTAKEVWKDE